MTKLQPFTVQAETEGRGAHKRDSERSCSLWNVSDLQRSVRQRELEDASPHCKSCQALSLVQGRLPLYYHFIFRGCLIACISHAYVWAADISASDRSSLAELCQQEFHSGYTSVGVGRDAGVSSFSDIRGLSVSVS